MIQPAACSGLSRRVLRGRRPEHDQVGRTDPAAAAEVKLSGSTPVRRGIGGDQPLLRGVADDGQAIKAPGCRLIHE